MSTQKVGQNREALQKNADFFAENEWYKSNQSRLEIYRLIAEAAAHEVETAERLLDIGNGGVFIFPIDHIPHVEAIDLFVEESFAQRYPNVQWRAMNILDLEDRDRFHTSLPLPSFPHLAANYVSHSHPNPPL